MCPQESFKVIKHFNNTKESMHAIRFNLSGCALSVAEFGRLWHLPLALYDIPVCRLLKEAGPIIATSLTCIINKTIDTGLFPSQWLKYFL